MQCWLTSELEKRAKGTILLLWVLWNGLSHICFLNYYYLFPKNFPFSIFFISLFVEQQTNGGDRTWWSIKLENRERATIRDTTRERNRDTKTKRDIHPKNTMKLTYRLASFFVFMLSLYFTPVSGIHFGLNERWMDGNILSSSHFSSLILHQVKTHWNTIIYQTWWVSFFPVLSLTLRNIIISSRSTRYHSLVWLYDLVTKGQRLILW